jgi:oxygen-independent coproporphyrinogen-3 oxidase
VDAELKRLGRSHNFEQAKQAIFYAHEAGFDNISADLMLGIPEQTKESLEFSIIELSKLPLTHISAYILKIEENTPFNNLTVINSLPDEDDVADLYLQAVEQLESNGFIQYEISNFAKSGFECKHNLKYWRCEEYIGLGPSAHSFWNGKRYEVPKNLDDFINSEYQTEIINEENPHTFDEVAMLKLRLKEGLSRKICEEFNVDFERIIKKAEPLKKAGLVKISDDKISITKEGFLVSNEIISRIIY